MTEEIIYNNYFSSIYKQYIHCYDDFICKFIKYNDKMWEEHLCEIIVDNIDNNKEFIDIGANIGLISLGVNKLALENNKCISNIHCFECDTNTFNLLVNNTSILNNCKLYPFAISDKLQLCLMSKNNYNRGCNFIYSTVNNYSTSNYTYPFIHSTNNFEKNIFVSSISLDDIHYQFTNVGVIKIDVEGFEYYVLLGAQNIIIKYKPVIIMEIWDINKEKIFSLMKDKFNYTIELIKEQDYICKSK